MSRYLALVVVTSAASLGCGFSSTSSGSGAMLGDDGGNDDGGGSDAASGPGDTEGTTTATTGGASAAGSVTDPGSGSGPGGDASTSADGTTGGPPPDPCNPAPPEEYEIDISMALYADPVQTGMHSVHGTYGYSTVPGAGTISFPFTANCPGTFFVHAFVYDDEVLNGLNDNADSFSVRIDGSPSTTWQYGCQALFGTPWGWHQVAGPGCIDAPSAQWSLAAAPHTVHFVNLELGSEGDGADDPGNVAAITRIIVTNDPSVSP